MKQRRFVHNLWTVSLLGFFITPSTLMAHPVKVHPATKAAPIRPKATTPSVAVQVAPATQRATKTTIPVAMPPQNSMLYNIILSRTARICVRADIPPLGYFKGETLSGFDIALAKAVVMGLSLRYKRNISPQWIMIRAADRIPSLRKGQCDFVVAAFSKTAARAKQVSFSQIYYTTSKVVLSRKSKISSAPVVARVSKTTKGSFSIPNAVYSSFMSYNDILYTMRQKLVDYVITDYPIGLFLVRHSHASYKLFRTLPNQEHYSIGVNQKHTYLLQEINQILTQLKQTGRISYLRRHWLR